MRSLLLIAALVVCAPARAGVVPVDAPKTADWRASGLDDGARDALRGAGYRLQDDGSVLDPETHAALTPDQLAAALSKLGLSSQRLALERLSLLLAKGPLSAEDRAAARALKPALPDDLAKALDRGADAAELKKMADADLGAIAAWFDGSRTADDRKKAAEPVAVGAPGPRAPLPYLSSDEKKAGDALRAASSAALGRDPFGRKILARLDGAGGKPDLPPMLVDDLPAGEIAEYDRARRALVFDRRAAIAAATGLAAPADRSALEKSLGTSAALTAYFAAHPDAAAALAAQNDALLAHELTHAWQDRRDAVGREMARGNLPAALVVDDEVEAWETKNLYVASRLKNDPGAKIDPFELEDFQRMIADRAGWEARLKKTYFDASTAALDLATVAEIQARRTAAVRARAVSDTASQEAKALDLLAASRAAREVDAARDAQTARLKTLGAEADRAARRAPKVLAEHYLAVAESASSQVDAAVALDKADGYAVLSGDADLIAKVRARKGRRR